MTITLDKSHQEDHLGLAMRLQELDVTTLHIGSTAVTSTAAELNALDGVTASFTELNSVDRSRFVVFDDFFTATFDETNNWISFEGSGATAAAHVDNPEGKLSMTSGAVGDVNDGVVVSSRVLANGALVSDGLIVFETRVAMDVLTGCNFNAGLSDKICTAAELPLYRINSGTVADGGLTLTNAILLGFDTDATAASKWQFVNESAGTINVAAAESAHTTGPTADIYAVIRIEVDADGTGRWYLDGTLINTVATAVATTAVLVPYISINTADDAQSASIADVDYIYFSGARPASDA